MITIDLLKNHSNAIPALAHIWHEVLGKILFPALTFKLKEEFRADLGPWLE